MGRYKVLHAQGMEREVIYDRIRRTVISQFWTNIYAEGLINGKSEYYIVKNADGRYAVFSRRNANTPVSEWFKEIKIEGLANGSSEYYLATNENNQMALFHKSNPSIPITPWWDGIICGDVLLGKSKYFIAQQQDHTTNKNKYALFQLNIDDLDQPVVQISQWWDWINIPNGDVKYYVAMNNDEQVAIFHINDPYDPVSRWWKKIVCDTLLSLTTEYYIATNREDKQAIFHIGNPNEPISKWFKDITYPDGLFNNTSSYYMGTLEEETDDGTPKRGIFHKDSKDVVSGSWLGHWEEIETKYGLLNGNSDFLLVRNANNQYAIFHKDNPYKPISGWWDEIIADGLLKGETEYYIAKNQEGKIAIFHKDNPDKPVSDWWDDIYLDGLIKGESEYYIVKNQYGQKAIFHKDYPYEPVSQWWDDISINGLVKGESEYYIATYTRRSQQSLQPNTPTSNVDTLLDTLIDNETIEQKRTQQGIFYKDDPYEPVSGWWDGISIIDNTFEYYIARNQTDQYAIFYQHYPRTPISEWCYYIHIANTGTSYTDSSTQMYYIARKPDMESKLHIYQIRNQHGNICNEECYQIEEPEMNYDTPILYIDNNIFIYLQENRLNIYSTYLKITQQILLKNKNDIDMQTTKELIKEYIKYNILPIAYCEPRKSRLYTLPNRGDNINQQNNCQLFKSVQEMETFLQAHYKPIIHNTNNDNMIIYYAP